jgi:plasmid stability protein
MPAIYVRNVPSDIYEALRKRAKRNHRTIRAEFIALLEQYFPTEKEMQQPRKVVLKLTAGRSKPAASQGGSSR